VLHIVEKHIDYNYDWNEWSLRRKAIQVLPALYGTLYPVAVSWL
jgi:hypothetical protein